MNVAPTGHKSSPSHCSKCIYRRAAYFGREWPGAPRKNGLALVPGKILCSEVVQVTPKLYRLLHDPRERHALRCWIRERTEHIRQFARGQTRLNRWGDKP